MNETEKNTVRAQVNAAATQGAKQAAEAAKTATGWKKWALVALAVILAGLAVFTQTQCNPGAAGGRMQEVIADK